MSLSVERRPRPVRGRAQFCPVCGQEAYVRIKTEDGYGAEPKKGSYQKIECHECGAYTTARVS